MRASVADHGAIWIMLSETTAAADEIGQGCSMTSRSNGERTFWRSASAIQCAMDRSEDASHSLGCQVRCGITRPKWTTCCPVPLPISSTSPSRGSTSLRMPEMGSLLRSADGLAKRSPTRPAGVARRIVFTHAISRIAMRLLQHPSKDHSTQSRRAYKRWPPGRTTREGKRTVSLAFAATPSTLRG